MKQRRIQHLTYAYPSLNDISVSLALRFLITCQLIGIVSSVVVKKVNFNPVE